DFWEHFPEDLKLAKDQTEIKMMYDDKFLYIGVTVHTVGTDFNNISLMRDYDGGSNDAVHFLFDTYSDNVNAFYFSVTPYGVVRDGYISKSGSDNDLFWDTTWYADAEIYDNKYTIEIKIPFFAFKYKKNTSQWRFNCYRDDPQTLVNSVWAAVPRNQDKNNLGFFGKINFEKPLQKSRNPIAIIPYALYSADQYHTDDGKTSSSSIGVGGDVKIPIGSSLNLDLTANPDFSSTAVNEGSTNITRFELNFPEQRQFFLDNSDLFGGFGTKNNNPFYSRRVGFATDKEGNDIENKILLGARLSGKIGDSFRIGLLDVQTAEDEENEIPSNNNMVIAMQQNVFKKSNIGMIFINRQATSPPDFVEESERYNRVVGLDYNYYSNNNKWNGKAYFHKSFTPEAGNKDVSSGAYINYDTRKFFFESILTYIGGDYKSDLGFTQRTNTAIVAEKGGYRWYPENTSVNRFQFRFDSKYQFQPDTGKRTDHYVGLQLEARFINDSRAKIEFFNDFIYLDKPFDPTKTGKGEIPVGDYSTYGAWAIFTSNQANLFSYDLYANIGSFYNGKKYTAEMTFRYRIQPKFNTFIVANIDYMSLPYADETVMYIGPRFEFTFTKNLYWTTDIQFNSQDENLGINSRIQWRYRPLSDIFLIYKDNYRTDEFSPTARAIFLKATFWLNL
ncbi:MAG: carbohydrate binding family 9 domain-containing protein, partial [Bacteroidales bacterium]|nr:carbohydrate binding family 9 domain-containing protein [Bacteroidales bacterium]